jgi:hypothetical protein
MADDEPRKLDFGLVQPQIKELIFAAGNWIEREWPGKRGRAKDHEGSRSLFLGLLRSSQNTWSTAAYICADVPNDPARKPEFALSLSPLARTVLEALCTTIFVFSDLEKRVAWFYRAGWREVREERDRLRDRYGNDADWLQYITSLDQLLIDSTGKWGVSASEVSDPSSIKRFPIPGRMVKDRTLTLDRRQQLQYLLDWYYKTMSQDAHLSWPGLARRAGAFFPSVTEEERRRVVALRRTQMICDLAALEVALVSEIEIECRFGMAKQAQYIWTVLADFSPDTKELYDRFYREPITMATRSR